MLGWILLTLAVVANIASNFLFKTAMAAFPSEISVASVLRFALNPYLWMAVLCCAVLLSSYLLALRQIELTVSYSFVVSLSLVGIMVLSPVILGEPLRFQTMAGAILVIGGILLITSASKVAPQLTDGSHQTRPSNSRT